MRNGGNFRLKIGFKFAPPRVDLFQHLQVSGVPRNVFDTFGIKSSFERRFPPQVGLSRGKFPQAIAKDRKIRELATRGFDQSPNCYAAVMRGTD